jgi:lipopolysaccharide transport system ATP-binding protein
VSDVVLKCDHVSKKFCKSLKRSMMYGAIDILSSSVGVMPDSSKLRADEFVAVDDVSFEVKAGESFGLIGPNGSGKTTLLKMINGIFMPDQGKITINGRVGGLIQVGAGFHPMLSGRENIYVNGAILGMTKKEIDSKFDSIVDFADIGDFLDSPVKFYSSGMYVRLGFAIAVHSEPDILLVDEVLAVGDLRFQTKCLKFITNNILKRGCAVLFVSHNRYAIEDVCQKALYLNKGKPVAIGQTPDVIGRYLDDIQKEEASELKESAGSFDQDGITKVEFLDRDGKPKEKFNSGDFARIRFHYSFKDPLCKPSVGITFIHNDPRYTIVSSTDYIFNLHSGYDGFQAGDVKGQGYFEVSIDCLYIPVGMYTYSVYLYSDNHMNLISKYEKAGSVEVLWKGDHPKRSLIELPHQWTKS